MSTMKTDPVGAGEPMHLVTIDWRRGKWSSTRGKYSREHQWHFAGKLSLKVSDAMAPAAYRDPARLDRCAIRETKGNGVQNPTPIGDGSTCKLQSKFGVSCLEFGTEQCGSSNTLCTVP